MQRNRTRTVGKVHNRQPSEPPPKRTKTKHSGKVTIESLPIDILVKVAKYVAVAQWPSLESVSRTFRDAIYEAWRTTRKIRLDEDLLGWRFDEGSRFDEDSSGDWTDDSDEDSSGMIGHPELVYLALQKLTRRAPNITDIGGFGKRGLKVDRDWISPLARFEKLERIEFGSENVPVDDLAEFLKRSASRRELKEVNAYGSMLAWVSPEEGLLFGAFSEQGGLAPLKLETFDLSVNPFLHCSSSFLDVIDVSKLTSFLVLETRVHRSLFVNFLNRATNLEKLSFSFDCYLDDESCTEFWDGEDDKHGVDPGAVQLVLQLHKEIIRAVGNLERLTSLKMKTSQNAWIGCDCQDFEIEMAEMLNRLGRWGTLVELSLLSDLATAAAVNAVGTSFPNLHSLELFTDRCGGGALELALKAQISLMDLRVCGNDCILSARVIPNIMANALRLQSLCLHYFGGPATPKENLLQIAACKQLKELMVYSSGGNNVDDETLVAWAEAFGSKLEVLVIPHCEKVTDVGVLALIKKTPRLRELNLAYASITDRCLKEMATHCRELWKFDLSYCRAVTDAGAQALIDGCIYLKRLHMAGDFWWFPEGLVTELYRKMLFFATLSWALEFSDYLCIIGNPFA